MMQKVGGISARASSTSPKQLLRLALPAIMVLAMCAPAFSQTDGSTGGQTTVMNIPTRLSAEGVVPLNFVLAAAPGRLPTNVLTQLATNTLEVRQRISLTTETPDTVAVEIIAVPPTSVLPSATLTPPGTLISRITIRIRSSIASVTPEPNLLLSGTVQTSSGMNPFGNLTGRAAAVAVGFSEGAFLQPSDGGTAGQAFSQVSFFGLLVAGSNVIMAPSAIGSISFAAGEQPGGGGTPGGQPGDGDGRAPIAVIEPIDGPITTASFQLNALRSSDPDGGPLTFSWRVVRGGTANLIRANSPFPTVTPTGGAGEYVFEVSVTDISGMNSTSQITVDFQPTGGTANPPSNQ